MDYKVISREVKDNVVISVLRMANGATVTSRKPIHTPEEQQKINDDFLLACARILYPNMDLSNVKKITMICK